MRASSKLAMVAVVVLIAPEIMAFPAFAQNAPAAGAAPTYRAPRTADGKPNLTAPAPRTTMSSIWLS